MFKFPEKYEKDVNWILKQETYSNEIKYIRKCFAWKHATIKLLMKMIKVEEMSMENFQLQMESVYVKFLLKLCTFSKGTYWNKMVDYRAVSGLFLTLIKVISYTCWDFKLSAY